MKKFFEKYDLVKLSGILLLLSVLLTWIIPQGAFQYGEMSVNEISRVGFTNLVQYSLLGVYYFTVLVTFLFVLGGFYQVLSKTAGYQELIRRISKKLKGHEIIFVTIVSLVIACWTSVANEYFPILVIIPFIITILNRLKVDKIAAFSSTFGAVLVGTIGSTYSSKVAGYITSTFADSYIVVKYILLAVAFILLTVFTIIRMKKNKDSNYDLFEIETVKSNKSNPKVWPYAISMILIFLFVFLGYMPWETWGIEIFAKATDWVNNFQIFGIPVFSYLFGDFVPFGNERFSIFMVQYVMVFMMLLISTFGKVSLDNMITSIGEGARKVSKTVVIMLIIYATVLFALFFPTIPTIVDWLAGLTNGFNAIIAGVNAFISSVFGVEMYYAMNLAGNYYASTFGENADIIAIIFQSMFGFAGFFVPTSVALMLGLSYLDIRYKDWMKFIWKFLVAMLVVIVLIIAIMMLFVL